MSGNTFGTNLVALDFDGVVVDSEKVVWMAHNHASLNHALMPCLDRASFIDLFNGSFHDSVGKMNKATLHPDVLESYRQDLKTKLLQSYQQVPLVKGMQEVVEALALSDNVIIVSYNWPEVISKVLYDANKFPVQYPIPIFGAGTYRSKSKCLERLSRAYPDGKVYYVTDTVGDLVEAKQVPGILTIAVGWGYHDIETLKLQRPNYSVESQPHHILDIVNGYQPLIRNTSLIKEGPRC